MCYNLFGCVCKTCMQVICMLVSFKTNTTLLWCVRHMLLISSKLSVSCDVTSQFWVSRCGYSSCSGRHRVLMYAHLYIRCGRQQLEPLLKGDAVDGNLIGSLIEPLHTCNTSCQRTSVKPIHCETCLKLFTHSQMCVHSFAQITRFQKKTSTTQKISYGFSQSRWCCGWVSDYFGYCESC